MNTKTKVNASITILCALDSHDLCHKEPNRNDYAQSGYLFPCECICHREPTNSIFEEGNRNKMLSAMTYECRGTNVDKDAVATMVATIVRRSTQVVNKQEEEQLTDIAMEFIRRKVWILADFMEAVESVPVSAPSLF